MEATGLNIAASVLLILLFLFFKVIIKPNQEHKYNQRYGHK